MNNHQPPKQSSHNAPHQADSEALFMAQDDYEGESLECQLDSEFVDAMSRGDAPAVVRALRKMKQLDGVTLEILADHFEGTACPETIFPFELRFVRRRRGRPVDARSQARPLHRAIAVNRALETCPKKEAAVADVMEKTGRSRATIFKALKKNAPPKVK